METQLVQTKHNLKRLFNDSKIDKEAYAILEARNKEALEEWERLNKMKLAVSNCYIVRDWMGTEVFEFDNYKDAKHYFIWHDGTVRQYYDGYLFFGQGEKDAHARRIYLEKAFVLPRPLLDYNNI